MDIVIIFAQNFAELGQEYLSTKTNKTDIIEKTDDIYPVILKDKAVMLAHNSWNFLCLNINHCFAEDFNQSLAKLSKKHDLYMFALNDIAGGMWFEFYRGGKLQRHWMEVESIIEGNMGEYLPAEQVLGYPFVDEAYENVGDEMLYELIYEITDFDITEVF